MDDGVAREVDGGAELYLAKAIEESIGSDDRTAELGVQVQIKAGRVVLRGTVATPGRKQAATSVAAERAPGREIVNKIVVVDPGVGHRGREPTEETLR